VNLRHGKLIEENGNSVLKPKTGSNSLASGFLIYLFLSFSSRKLHKNYHTSYKINLHICLMLSIYKSVHQLVSYGCQRNQILQYLTGLET